MDDVPDMPGNAMYQKRMSIHHIQRVIYTRVCLAILTLWRVHLERIRKRRAQTIYMGSVVQP